MDFSPNKFLATYSLTTNSEIDFEDFVYSPKSIIDMICMTKIELKSEQGFHEN